MLPHDCQRCDYRDQPETDCGTSLTNIWCQEFFEVLNDLEPVRAAGEGRTLRWFEHYDREDPTLDEVILTEDGRVTWQFHASGDDLAKAFEQLTGETIPDFAGTGFEEQLGESLRQERSNRRL